jgi:hypothetical protein
MRRRKKRNWVRTIVNFGRVVVSFSPVPKTARQSPGRIREIKNGEAI